MSNSISILNIIHDTTVDGSGFRTAIYAAGCKHRCPGCHNPQSWNIDNGILYSINNLLEIVKASEFANVTFTGGDPFMQVEGFTELARRIKAETKKNIWCYTGFLYEQIVHSIKLSSILPFIDVLVDGQYIAVLRDEDLQFRGSKNQRLIDVPQSIKTDKITLWDNEYCAELPYYIHSDCNQN
ncbi:MAG: anaerobic ribonucleoside-triphosphate reductase activating protein [Dysgonomonas sp.]